MLRTTEAALALAGLAGLLLLATAVPSHADRLSDLGLDVELRVPLTRANPPLPDTMTFPVQLVLDDDNAEGAFGFSGANARQFLWLNRFVSPGMFFLEEIWVLFPGGADIPVGGAVELAVFLDPDGDPTNGADLVATYDETIQAADGNTFSVYALATPLEITGDGDVLIGVVNRYFTLGDPPPTRPAAFDNTASQMRSYFALWAGDVPDPINLATASVIDVFDGAVTGNFMIRGLGTPIPTPIPTLGAFGAVFLGMVLGLAGALVLRRRRSSRFLPQQLQ